MDPRASGTSEFADTALTLLGLGHGWIAMTPFLLVVAPPRSPRVTGGAGRVGRLLWSLFATTVGAWACVALAGRHRSRARPDAIAALVAACAVCAIGLPARGAALPASSVARRSRRRGVAASPARRRPVARRRPPSRRGLGIEPGELRRQRKRERCQGEPSHSTTYGRLVIVRPYGTRPRAARVAGRAPCSGRRAATARSSSAGAR